MKRSTPEPKKPKQPFEDAPLCRACGGVPANPQGYPPQQGAYPQQQPQTGYPQSQYPQQYPQQQYPQPQYPQQQFPQQQSAPGYPQQQPFVPKSNWTPAAPQQQGGSRPF